MSQHQDVQRPQEGFEADEAQEYPLDSDQSKLFAPRLGLFIELRFAIALISIILLLTMSVVNMVIELQLETVLHTLGPYFPGDLRVLFYTLSPLALAIFLTVLLIWLNGFVSRQTRSSAFSNPFGEKLVASRPPSIGQRLGLIFFSAGLVVTLCLTMIIYMRFGPYLSDVLSQVTIARRPMPPGISQQEK